MQGKAEWSDLEKWNYLFSNISSPLRRWQTLYNDSKILAPSKKKVNTRKVFGEYIEITRD